MTNIWYRFPSCIGEIAAITIDDEGALTAEFLATGKESEQAVPLSKAAPLEVRRLAAMMQSHLAGEKQQYDHAALIQAHRLPTFRKQGLIAMSQIKFGTTATYSDLARLAGNAKAIRAAGTVCSNNPLPIVFPCHRVVPKSGGLGNFGGGVAMKRKLLTIEKAQLVV